MLNKVGREVPEYIQGYGAVRPYAGTGAARYQGSNVVTARKSRNQGNESKLLATLDEAIEKSGLRDGMTISFHHHLRNGDYVTAMVMEAIHRKGIKALHVAASGLFACHDSLVPMIEDGTITAISVSTFGPGGIAEAVSAGKLKYPAVMRTHGGRPRAIESGELHIDVAFIAAPCCDAEGNMNGSHGKSACGCLSYSYADAEYADCVVAITDSLVEYPCVPAEIKEDYVDYVVTVDSIGDPQGIVSGAMKVTTDEKQLEIAQMAADVLEQAGYICDRMSFQTGVGGISLAVASKVREAMLRNNVKGSFGSGGISGYLVEMLEDGLFQGLWDVQCFDAKAIENLAKDPRHMIMSGSLYGNPERKSCIVDHLDIVILGALEVDVNFNINVTTGSDGVIRSASGGNSDTAAGSKISLVVSSLMKKGNRCLIKDTVTTVTTPGETVDVIVTDYGIAVNPKRKDILERLSGSTLPILDIAQLYEIGKNKGAVQDEPDFAERIVGVVEYRDGTVIDVVKMVRK